MCVNLGTSSQFSVDSADIGKYSSLHCEQDSRGAGDGFIAFRQFSFSLLPLKYG